MTSASTLRLRLKIQSTPFNQIQFSTATKGRRIPFVQFSLCYYQSLLSSTSYGNAADVDRCWIYQWPNNGRHSNLLGGFRPRVHRFSPFGPAHFPADPIPRHPVCSIGFLHILHGWVTPRRDPPSSPPLSSLCVPFSHPWLLSTVCFFTVFSVPLYCRTPHLSHLSTSDRADTWSKPADTMSFDSGPTWPRTGETWRFHW